MTLLVEQLFGTPISTFFAADLILTAVVFWVFLYQEARRLQMSRWWVYIIATLLVSPVVRPAALFVLSGNAAGGTLKV